MIDINFILGSDVGGIVLFWDIVYKFDGWLFIEVVRNN